MSFVETDLAESVLPDGTVHPGVRTETMWAVDMNPSMCDTFKANYPRAKVRTERHQRVIAHSSDIKANSGRRSFPLDAHGHDSEYVP
jgi:hypothetical protein